MLNRPKFMSPSINMYGSSVIDLNSAKLPFSCVIDGNEAIKGWQIRVSRLKDNVVVFDTGEKMLASYFYPVNNRNQNVAFTIDLKDCFSSATTCYISAESTYSKDKFYYTHVNGVYEPYTNNGSESTPSSWSTDYKTLCYTNFVNSKEPYYWSVVLHGSGGSITQSAEEVFYANSIPDTTIYYNYENKFPSTHIFSEDEDAPSVVEGRKVFLKTEYNQKENIPIKRYGWRLVDSSNENVVIDTINKNQVYGITEDISCECNGLVSGSNYSLDLYIETQNGYFGVVKSIKFKVSYKVQNLEAKFDVRPINETSGIMLNWSDLKTTEGVVVGKSVEYVDGKPLKDSVSVSIPENSKIVFEGTSNDKELNIDENAYVVLSFQFEKFKNSFTIFNMSGLDKVSSVIERNLCYNHLDNRLEYTVTKGAGTLFKSVGLSDNSGQRCWCVVIMSPTLDNDIEVNVVESVAENSLIPSEILFPNKDEFPYFGDWNKMSKKGG